MSTRCFKYFISTLLFSLFISPVSAAVIFHDDFNRSNTSSVGNHWNELEKDGNDVAIWRNAVRLRDTQSGVDAAITQAISASGFDNLGLDFDWSANSSTEPSDMLFVSWSANQTDWTDIWSTSLGGSSFSSATIDDILGLESLETVYLRFWIDVSSATETVYLDNIQVTGTPIAETSVATVPEPGSLALLALGLFGLGVSRKRKIKA